jgi:hypothetical protein
MRRTSVFIVAGIIVLTALLFVIANGRPMWTWFRPPVAGLPNADEVAEMRASLLEGPVGFPRTPEFIVPADHVPVILGWLWPGDYDAKPPIFPHDELGEILIKTKTGRELRLRFYWAGKNPAVYTFDGSDYFWGNGEDEQGKWVDGGGQLCKAIRAAFEASER